MSRIKKQGFTLLEILVALTVLAVAMSALIKSSAENAENATYLRDKTLAHWVAMNVFTEIQIREKWEKEGSVMMAKREWFWTVSISETGEKELHRLDIHVRLHVDEEPIAVLVGFLVSKTETSSFSG